MSRHSKVVVRTDTLTVRKHYFAAYTGDEKNCVIYVTNTLQDVDEFFEHQKTFLVEYHTRIKGGTEKADRMTKTHKSK